MIQLLIAGIVIILVALGAMLLSHSQSLQRFAVLEFLLIAAVLIVAVFSLSKTQTFMREHYFSLFGVYIHEAQLYAQELEESAAENTDTTWQKAGDDLQLLLEGSLPVTTVDEEETRYLTAAIYERMPDGQYLERVYRQNKTGYLTAKECKSYVEKYAEQTIRLGSVPCEETELGTGALVYTGSGIVAPRYVFFTEIPLEPLWDTIAQLQKEYAICGGVFLLLGTLLLAGVIFLQGRQLHELTLLASRVAEGKSDWDALQEETHGFWIESNEIRGLRNSLGQIAADVARMNYMKYRIMQGYYRFAPKQIETILGRSSILEVEANDRVHVTGTLAFVAYPEDKRLEEQQYLRRMNQEYELLGEKQKEYDGILLSNNSDLTTLQLLFQEETKKALHFGIDVSMRQENERERAFFVLLHRTSFVYGVAGNDEQAFTYVLSKEMKRLEKYVERFRTAGIRMAVTDAVYDLIEKETSSRYIGYLEEDGYTFKLYEILDAYPAKQRQRRLDTREKFEKALNLFYQGDYYLGRNLFTEVLKESPDDEVAKGYLFLCEKCLNADCRKDISCALFSE